MPCNGHTVPVLFLITFNRSDTTGYPEEDCEISVFTDGIVTLVFTAMPRDTEKRLYLRLAPRVP